MTTQPDRRAENFHFWIPIWIHDSPQKQPFVDVLQNWCNKACHIVKKTPPHRCFHVNIVKFFKTPPVLLPSISHLPGINLSSVAFFIIMLISDVTKLKKSLELWTKEHMHINKFSECAFWNFWNEPSEERVNFKFHKMSEVKWSNFHLTEPVNLGWQCLKNPQKA